MKIISQEEKEEEEEEGKKKTDAETWNLLQHNIH